MGSMGDRMVPRDVHILFPGTYTEYIIKGSVRVRGGVMTDPEKERDLKRLLTLMVGKGPGQRSECSLQKRD